MNSSWCALRLYALNMRAPFLMMQGAATVMKDNGGGSIVNIGSVNGHGGQSNLPVYSSTKGALMTMTKHAAWALRRDKIRANYLAVGWMYTPAEDALMQSEGSGPEWIDSADKNHPYGRLLRPVDIAKMVVHLLSDDSVMQSGGIIDCESYRFLAVPAASLIPTIAAGSPRELWPLLLGWPAEV